MPTILIVEDERVADVQVNISIKNSSSSTGIYSTIVYKLAISNDDISYPAISFSNKVNCSSPII
jgi:hypothetical protein